ncbi:hypothetical protein FHS90_002559 [Rufibacter quisquiliarum]|uniref:Uncharacterized protein n=1 Tax=Rufibacter quisquiliarum TaxID=1549639 RepID=A0A839GGZ2_9BACT|nr:hypothetical protein [Rufibacter quisquiliarum]
MEWEDESEYFLLRVSRILLLSPYKLNDEGGVST